MSMLAPQWSYTKLSESRLTKRYPLSNLFEYSAELYTNNLAISDNKKNITFFQLEEGSKRIACHLHELGVKPGSHVMVMAEKCHFMPVIISAIWKLGAVYIPVDRNNPLERNKKIIDQVKPSVIIDRDILNKDNLYNSHFVSWILLEKIASSNSSSSWVTYPVINENETAYIIFTSGSTGTPKGVMISHKSLLDYFSSHNDVLRYTENSRVFSMAPFHFDVSLEDTILPLSVGAYVYQFNGMSIGILIRNLIKSERISHLIAVSTLLALITDDGEEINQKFFPALKLIMTGAEICDPKIINHWVTKLPNARVINAYGPTEATIVCLTNHIKLPDFNRKQSFAIGKPLNGVKVRIENNGVEIKLSGKKGELLIGGSQVMNGYLNSESETELSIVNINECRFYRTGDICQYDENGMVEFIGRNDDEVKLNGRRIRLGEIRQIALSNEFIKSASVGLIKITTNQIALIVMVDSNYFNKNILFNHLKNNLPNYMIPQILAVCHQYNISSSGKTNEKNLLLMLQSAVIENPGNLYVLKGDSSFKKIETKRSQYE